MPTLLQPHSAVNDNNYNQLSNRSTGGFTHAQRLANVHRVMNNNQQQNNNSLLPTRGTGAIMVRNTAPSWISPSFGGGNWMSSIVYGGLAGLAVSVFTNNVKPFKKGKKAQMARMIGLVGTSAGMGMVLKQPGQLAPHIPSMLGAAAGFIIAANLLGMNLKMPSPLQEVLPPWAVRAGK